jgi:predicted GNAT family acetyltransferase
LEGHDRDERILQISTTLYRLLHKSLNFSGQITNKNDDSGLVIYAALCSIVKANGKRVNVIIFGEYNWAIERSDKENHMQTNNIKVIHNIDAHRFEVHVDSYLAELNYHLNGGGLIFTHTGVPSELEGRGIGSLLVRTGLKYARENNLKVQSLCWFVDKYMQRHPNE